MVSSFNYSESFAGVARLLTRKESLLQRNCQKAPRAVADLTPLWHTVVTLEKNQGSDNAIETALSPPQQRLIQ
jgi:hypothetical protein